MGPGAASGGNSFRALQMMGLGEDYAKVAGGSRGSDGRRSELIHYVR